MQFILKPSAIENIEIYSKLLDKEVDEIIEEALDSYFTQVQNKLLKKNISDENAMTNLDYNEFWDGVDL